MSRLYRAESAIIRRNAGRPNPTNAASAPAVPRMRRPVYAATCMAVAPGIAWQSATPSSKTALSIQPFCPTAIFRM